MATSIMNRQGFGYGTFSPGQTISSAYPDFEEARVAFSERFLSGQLLLFEEALKGVPFIERNVERLLSDLEGNPYATESFFDEELESTALYALRQGSLTEFAVANLLLFKALCQAHGRENVGVHFLLDERGEIDEVARASFLSAEDSLIGGLLSKLPATSEALDSFIQTKSLSRYLSVFFSYPSHGQRSFLLTPQLVQEHLSKLSTGGDRARAYPVFWVPHPWIDSTSETDFLRREIFIPSSTPLIRKSCWGPQGSLRKGTSLDLYTEDLRSLAIDLCNPHLRAFQELWNAVHSSPHAREWTRWRYDHPRDLYAVRGYSIYRNALLEGDLGSRVGELFWSALQGFLSNYMNWFENDWRLRGVKGELRGIVAYIGANSERWKQKYGIDLDFVARTPVAQPFPGEWPGKAITLRALHELAAEHIKERSFSSRWKSWRNMQNEVSDVLAVTWGVQTGGD